MPKLVLTELLGMNANGAALQLRPGEAQMMQNVWTRPFKNWRKRNGITSAYEQDGPVLGIFEIELENIVVPIVIEGDPILNPGGGGGTIFPDLDIHLDPVIDPTGGGGGGGGGGGTVTLVTDPNETGEGRGDPGLDPEGGKTLLLLVEPVMRAISERFAILAQSPPVWPNRHFDEFGTYSLVGEAPTISRNVNEWRSDAADTAFKLPVNNFYQYDLAWADLKGTSTMGVTIPPGSPAGTYAALLMNTMRTALNTLITSFSWVNSDIGIEGQSAATDWTAATLPLPPVATTANYRQVYSQLRTAVRRLESFNFTLDQVTPTDDRSGSEEKEGSALLASPANTCEDAANLAFSRFTSASFTYSGSSIYVQEFEYFDGGNYGVSMTSKRGRLKSDTSIYTGGGSVAYYIKVNLLAPAPQGVSAYSPPASADSLYHRYGGSSLGSIDYSGTLGDETPTPAATCPLLAPTYNLNGWILDSSCLGNILPNWQYNP